MLRRPRCLREITKVRKAVCCKICIALIFRERERALLFTQTKRSDFNTWADNFRERKRLFTTPMRCVS
jgi:hypothetical protein